MSIADINENIKNLNRSYEEILTLAKIRLKGWGERTQKEHD